KRILEYNQLKEKSGHWSVDFEDLKKRASKGAKILILSNPHNPVGRVWTPEELKKIGDICLENNIIIISDEIHSDLVLPGNKHTPLASLSEELASITVTCMAPSKTFNLAGLSTSSMIISNKNLRDMFSKEIASLHIEMGNIFGNEASVAAYRNGAEWLDQLLTYLSKNVDYVMKRCSGSIPLIKPVRPEATYLIWLDCRDMGLCPENLGKFFSLKAGVGLNGGSVFGPGGEGYMRMNLATPLSVISKALDRIENAIKTL
ncbi:MAG: aminotransferase class I/II-fold pyridoxal phosphate-dependent enzyme, partial [Bacteroidales bacterium]|nr:aminotransferase class I/II-fold pyridoxal phosphate-dependent enzyme [Bacteroidales bacterium]